MVTEGQIPSSIMRDGEFTAATVRTLLSLTADEVNDLLVGASISGQVLSLPQNDGSTVTITIPTAQAGTGDGVVQSGAFNADQTELNLTLDNGGIVQINVPEALRMSGGVTETRVQELINATSLAALQGLVTDGQIPASIMRDAEFTAAAVRGLLNLTADEVTNILVGQPISGQVLTFTLNDGTDASITIPTEAGESMADGVVASGAFNDDQTELVLTLDTGGTVTIDVPAALHGGLRVITADANGRLPAAADNLGSIGLAGNHFYRAVGEQGSDKVVTFKNYSATRVVETGEPARSSDELLYAGSFANPPVGNYTLNAWAWDRGSEVWIRNLVHNGASWVSSVGPPAYHHGNLYQTEGDAAVHVPDATYEGRVYIIGHGSSQRPKIVTGYTAPTAPSAEWMPIGLTIQDIADQIAAHDVAETGTHGSIRSLIAAVEDRLDAIDVRDILEIAAYADNATYSFGGSNSIVTHGGNILVYISSVERSADHDPSLASELLG